MATPMTVRVAGIFQATENGAAAGEAVLRMKSATNGLLTLGARKWTLTGNVAAKTIKSPQSGSTLSLKIINRSELKGTLRGKPFELDRLVMRPIPAAEMAQSDLGPVGAMKAFMDTVPDYEDAAAPDTLMFWYEFGPVLYRGRLDGSARVLCIASDPGPSECLPFMRRALVGDSGQKVQGCLAKLGLTRSYVLANAYTVALHPSKAAKGRQFVETTAALLTWRHGFYDRLLTGGALEAIVLFGGEAHRAYDGWVAVNPAAKAVPVARLAHPAAIDRDGNADALKKWVRAITKLRTFVTPDPDGDATGPNYGVYFTENDYARIPRWDLPLQAPVYAGDDSWGRFANPQHNNSCDRPKPDDRKTLILKRPPGQGVTLRYRYDNGQLVKTTKTDGTMVPTDAFGIPLAR